MRPLHNETFKKCGPPRVLHLISSGGFLGAESVVLELAKEAATAGYWQTVGIFENQHNPHLELAEAAVARGLNVQVFPCRGRFDPRTISEVRKFIHNKRPNLVHSHGYKSNFYALIGNRGTIPWVVTNHLWKRTTRSLKLYACLDSFLIKYASKIIAVSDEIASEMSALGIPSNKLVVIDNGVQLNRFSGDKRNDALRQSFGIDEGCRIIATVASLTEEKGHSHLIQAAHSVISSFPKTRFLFIGDGPKRHQLEKKVSELGLEQKIIFAGSRQDVPQILSMTDLFVLPSLKEGLPMALLEALAASLPVVATNVGAIPKVIEDGHSGVLVQPGDAKELAKAIMDLLANPQKANRLAKNAHRKVKQQFSSERMAEKYIDVYQDVLGIRRAAG